MNRKILTLSSTMLAALLSTEPAYATSYLFQLSGSRDATFTIDTATTPDFQSSNAFGNQLSYTDVAGSYGGTAGVATIGFGTNVYATLNILGTPQGFTQFAGPDLFALAGTQPLFTVGTFALTSIVSGASTLTISTATAVPETATWAMFIGGLGFVGAAMRRRRRVSVTFA